WVWHQPELQRLCNVGRKKYFRLIREAKRLGFLRTVRERYIWNLKPVLQTGTGSEPVSQRGTGPVLQTDTEPVLQTGTLSKNSSSKNFSSENKTLLSPTGESEQTLDAVEEHTGGVSPKGEIEMLKDEKPASHFKEKNLPKAKRPTTKESPMLPLPPREDLLVYQPREPEVSLHHQCREVLKALYTEHYGGYSWDVVEGKQLALLLKRRPSLTAEELAAWFMRYVQSANHAPGARPCEFLSKAERYSIMPLDNFGNPLGAKSISKRIEQNAAFAAVRRVAVKGELR